MRRWSAAWTTSSSSLPASSTQLFALGLMGIEVPEELGGAGGTFFDAVLAIEAISTVDPAVAVLVDVHNTLVINALAPLGERAAEASLVAAAGRGHGGRLCTERGRFGVGCVCAADRRQRSPRAAIG